MVFVWLINVSLVNTVLQQQGSPAEQTLEGDSILCLGIQAEPAASE